MNTNGIDWAGLAARATRMTDAELAGARADILATLPYADDLDRADGGDRGGRYRDESSVYVREMNHRAALTTPDTVVRSSPYADPIARAERNFGA